MRLRRSFAMLAAGAAVAVTVTGCGQSAQTGTFRSSTVRSAPVDNGVAALPPARILARARTALLSAGTMRIRGTIAADGKRIGLDMRISRGRGAAGTLTVDGHTIELLRVGRAVYYKASRAFWRSVGGREAAELLTGKYLKIALGAAEFAELNQFTDFDRIAKDVLQPDGTVRKGARATLRGVKAIALTDSEGTLYVATTGRPYPLQLSGRGAGGSGTLAFTDFGQPFPLRSPPSDLVLDPSELGG